MPDPTDKQIENSRKFGVLAIVLSIVASFMISISADMSHMELGAIANVYFPPFIGAITLGVYILSCYITYTINVRIIVCIILVVCNIYLGISLKMG